ncbi:hypothetical protein FQN49_000416 [Arthroderma sp. PD_2]|nr:hypothetical protein FQN49_000416 [Arthroderma sp. PD_2]
MTSNYPEPLIIPSLRSHQYTFLLLHGRGSNAGKFGPTLLSSPVARGDMSPECTLISAFPHARFVFPTASKCRATVYKRSIINQWFDNWTLGTDTPETPQEKQQREYLQIDGLRETSLYLHELLKYEISLVGGNAKRIFFGGLSQGCAASLVALLQWDGDPLGAAIGMCGWLPFREQMEAIARGMDDIEGSDEVDGEDFNPFGDPGEDEGDSHDVSSPLNSTPADRAVIFLKDQLEMPLPRHLSGSLAFQRTPLFLGHGVEDEKVPVGLGREAASCLGAMGMDVAWNEYKGLGHWYSENMLSDLVNFLRQIEPQLEILPVEKSVIAAPSLFDRTQHTYI